MRGEYFQLWQQVVVIGIILTCLFWCEGFKVCAENGHLHLNCTHNGIVCRDTNCASETRNQSECKPLYKQMRKCFLQVECNISFPSHVCIDYNCLPGAKSVTFRSANYSSTGIFSLKHARRENEPLDNIECFLKVKDKRINEVQVQVTAFFLAPFADKNTTCLTMNHNHSHALCSGSGMISQTKTFNVSLIAIGNSMKISFYDRGTRKLNFQVLIYVIGSDRRYVHDSHLFCNVSESKHRLPETDPGPSEGESSTAIPPRVITDPGQSVGESSTVIVSEVSTGQGLSKVESSTAIPPRVITDPGQSVGESSTVIVSEVRTGQGLSKVESSTTIRPRATTDPGLAEGQSSTGTLPRAVTYPRQSEGKSSTAFLKIITDRGWSEVEFTTSILPKVIIDLGQSSATNSPRAVTDPGLLDVESLSVTPPGAIPRRQVMPGVMSATTQHLPKRVIPGKPATTVLQTTKHTDRTLEDARRLNNLLVPIGASVTVLFLIGSGILLVLIVLQEKEAKRHQAQAEKSPGPLMLSLRQVETGC